MTRDIFHILCAILGVIVFAYSLVALYKTGKSNDVQNRKEKLNAWSWLGISLFLLSAALYDFLYPSL